MSFAAACAAMLALAAVPGLAQYDAGVPLFQASSWNVVEDGGWTAVWTFNNGRRSMNGTWYQQSTGQRVNVANMRVTQNGDQIIVARPGLGNYVGTINSAGTSMAGTLSWSSGHFTASVGSNGGNTGYNGGGRNRAPMFAANSWAVTEDGGWTAVWTFDASHRTMSGRWTNNQTGERRRVSGMSVTQNGQQIIVNRPGLGNYVGTLSSDGNSMSGTLSWSSGHFSARTN